MAKPKKEAQLIDEQVNEQQEKKQESFVVAQKFVIDNNFSKVYQPGDSADHFSEERLKELIEKGLVSKK